MQAEGIEVPYREGLLPVEGNTDGPALYLTESVVRSIDSLLPKRVGREYHENVLYIAGMAEQGRRIGCTVIAPWAETGRGYYRTDRDSHSEVLDILDDVDLVAVAQVHCHPGWIVSHSNGDDELAFVRSEGFWSIVVPYYGKKGLRPVRNCGFHRFTGGEFRRLTDEAVERRIVIVPDFVKHTERKIVTEQNETPLGIIQRAKRARAKKRRG